MTISMDSKFKELLEYKEDLCVILKDEGTRLFLVRQNCFKHSGRDYDDWCIGIDKDLFDDMIKAGEIKVLSEKA